MQWSSCNNEFIRLAHDVGVPRRKIPQHVDSLGPLFNILWVNDFSRDWLETAVIVEDSGDDKFLSNPYVIDRLKLCREDNMVYYLTIHGFGQISPSIRQNSAVIVICKGLSAERLNIIIHQTNHNIDRKEFIDMYREMNDDPNARYLVVDTLASTVHIE
jgi:hypothetical protein